MRAEIQKAKVAGILISAAFLSSACSTVRPLSEVARRTGDPSALKSDVSVDTSSRHLHLVNKMAWAAYSVDFVCEKDCGYSLEQRKSIAREIAEKSFAAFDREIRKAVQGQGRRDILAVKETIESPSFKSEVRGDSYRSAVGRWLDRIGLTRSTDVVATAQGLKAIDPGELGWSGEESLAQLGRSLGVDGLLVGHIRVSPADVDSEDSPLTQRKLVVTGPKVWLFSTKYPKSVALARVRPNWLIAPDAASAGYDWKGLDELASGFRSRLAQGLE